MMATAIELMRIARRDRGGFLIDSDIEAMKADPSTARTPVVVRCGGCRFTTSATHVAHLIAIIEADGRDYVRDVSLMMSRDEIASLSESVRKFLTLGNDDGKKGGA